MYKNDDSEISPRARYIAGKKNGYIKRKAKIAAMSEVEREILKQKILDSNKKRREKDKDESWDMAVQKLLQENKKIMCLEFNERLLKRLNVNQIREAIEKEHEIDKIWTTTQQR